MKLSIL